MHVAGFSVFLISLFGTGNALDHRPAGKVQLAPKEIPRSLSLVQDAVKPPKGIKTVKHEKIKGNGYAKGSPLYKEQERKEKGLKADEAKLSPAPKESKPKSSPEPGFWLPTLSLLCGIGAVGLVRYANSKAVKQ